MERFLIESPHAVEKCDQAVQDLYAAGYLHHFEWGCKDNDHTGWAIVEAENAEDARQIVPWYLREKARIVRLVKFNPELDREVHKKTK
ncbi:MAG TPA: hypothetical protein VFI68_11995 [Anaerolineales bacterium]|nr:hypothetical protein [Anaerolineales bacterium]